VKELTPMALMMPMCSVVIAHPVWN